MSLAIDGKKWIEAFNFIQFYSNARTIDSIEYFIKMENLKAKLFVDIDRLKDKIAYFTDEIIKNKLKPESLISTKIYFEDIFSNVSNTVNEIRDFNNEIDRLNRNYNNTL